MIRDIHTTHHFLGKPMTQLFVYKNVLLKKILIHIYLPGSPNLGVVVYAKEQFSGSIGLKSSAML